MHALSVPDCEVSSEEGERILPTELQTQTTLHIANEQVVINL